MAEEIITKTFRKGSYMAPWEESVQVTGTPDAIEDWKVRRAARLRAMSDEEKSARAEEHARLVARRNGA